MKSTKLHSLLQKNNKILYIISGETGFKKTDEEILRSFAVVRKYNYLTFLDYLNPKMFFDFLWADSLLIWFASKHAITAVLLNYLFNKPIYIIAGGFDVANLPKIKYGAMQGGSRSKIGRWLLSRANSIIAVSKSNRREIIENGKVLPRKVKLIYNAIPKITPIAYNKKKNQVLTVGEINEETYLRKGLDRFIQVAEKMKNLQFFHIGKWTDNQGRTNFKMIEYVKSISPPNINYLGYVDKKELEKYYEESKIYLQLSRHEAFGVSVAEAMIYGCIPIVSNAYALPEVVNGRGYVVQTIQETISIAKRILNEDFKSARVKNPFPIFQRERGFRKILVN